MYQNVALGCSVHRGLHFQPPCCHVRCLAYSETVCTDCFCGSYSEIVNPQVCLIAVWHNWPQRESRCVFRTLSLMPTSEHLGQRPQSTLSGKRFLCGIGLETRGLLCTVVHEHMPSQWDDWCGGGWGEGSSSRSELWRIALGEPNSTETDRIRSGGWWGGGAERSCPWVCVPPAPPGWRRTFINWLSFPVASVGMLMTCTFIMGSKKKMDDFHPFFLNTVGKMTKCYKCGPLYQEEQGNFRIISLTLLYICPLNPSFEEQPCLRSGPWGPCWVCLYKHPLSSSSLVCTGEYSGEHMLCSEIASHVGIP